MNGAEELFRIVVAVSGALGTIWLTTIWGEMKDIRKQTQELNNRLSAAEILVAGQYIPRLEFHQRMTHFEKAMEDNFKMVFEKLDKKADKV